MIKPDRVFIWRSGSDAELPSVYQDFRGVFAGKARIPTLLHLADDEDATSITRDDLVPNAVAQAPAVVILLSGAEGNDKEFARLLQCIADAPRCIPFAPVFLRSAAKEWWSSKVEPQISGLSKLRVPPVNLWSLTGEPAELDGTDAESVRRVEKLQRTIDSMVRELKVTPAAAPVWGGCKDCTVVLLSPAEAEHSSLVANLIGALGKLSVKQKIIPITWPPSWQQATSQAHYESLFDKPVLFVRIIGDTPRGQESQSDEDFRQDVRSSLGLGAIDFGPKWVSLAASTRFDWAPPSAAGLAAPAQGVSTAVNHAGKSVSDLALEIARALGVVNPPPPRVSYITISRDPGRSRRVPNADTVETNLERELREALTNTVGELCTPPQPVLTSYHASYQDMITREIKSGAVPIILADDLDGTAQQLNFAGVLKTWQAFIGTNSSRKVIRGALIYSNFAESKLPAKFPEEEISEWFPLAVDGSGTIDESQLRALTEEVKKAFI